MSTDQLQNTTFEFLHQVADKLQDIIDRRHGHSATADDEDCRQHDARSGESTISDSKASSSPLKHVHRIDEDDEDDAPSYFAKRPHRQDDQDAYTQALAPVFSVKSEDEEIDIEAFSVNLSSPPNKQEHVEMNSAMMLEMPFILFQRLLDQCSDVGILNAIKSLPAVPNEINDACVQRIVHLMPNEEYDDESRTSSEPLGRYFSESDID